MIHNGTVIADRIHTDRGNHPFTIGSAGRFFPVKDYPFLVEVAAEINRYAKDVRFELAGEGPEFERVTERIQRYGLQDIFRLKGFMESMSEFYNGLDLYINTSLHEGFPMSVLEAMSHGLPVVAPKEGGIKEVVTDGVQGFLIEGRDPKRYAQKCLADLSGSNLETEYGNRIEGEGRQGVFDKNDGGKILRIVCEDIVANEQGELFLGCTGMMNRFADP